MYMRHDTGVKVEGVRTKPWADDDVKNVMNVDVMDLMGTGWSQASNFGNFLSNKNYKTAQIWMYPSDTH